MTQERLTRWHFVHVCCELICITSNLLSKCVLIEACYSATINDAADRAICGKGLVNNQVGCPWGFHTPDFERLVGVLANVCTKSRA